MTMKTKQRMLTEDWELFKQRRFMEEQVRLWAGGAVHRNGNCSLRVDGSKRRRFSTTLHVLLTVRGSGVNWFSFRLPSLLYPSGDTRVYRATPESPRTPPRRVACPRFTRQGAYNEVAGLRLGARHVCQGPCLRRGCWRPQRIPSSSGSSSHPSACRFGRTRGGCGVVVSGHWTSLGNLLPVHVLASLPVSLPCRAYSLGLP